MTTLPKTINWHGRRLRLDTDDGYRARYVAKGIWLDLSRDGDDSDWGAEVDVFDRTTTRLGILNAEVDRYPTLGAALNALDLLLKKAAP